MRTRSLQAIGFLSTHVMIAALLIWLSYVGVDHIPFGTFGRASVGDALSRMGLLMLLSPVIVIVAGYLTWMLLKSLHWIEGTAGFSWRLPLFCISAILLVWVANYFLDGVIGRFFFDGFGFYGIFAAPGVICLIAAYLAAAASIETNNHVNQ